jgi:anthranilate phosphoribosyltransferase
MGENKLIGFMGIVGGGARVSKDLSYLQAKDAMNALLDGEYHPVTFGSFTLAMRWKPETAEEMAGFADAMNGRIIKPKHQIPIQNLVSSAGAYDGKERTVNFSIAAALTAAAAGVPSLLHGSENIPAKRGMTPFHILNALEWNPLRDVDAVLQDLQQYGFGYLHQSVVNPAVQQLLDDRQQVGKRTFINSVEPLINPYDASVHIGGFFHRTFGELMSKATAKMKTGWQRTLMVAGIEGSEEIKPGRSFVVERRNAIVLYRTKRIWD